MAIGIEDRAIVSPPTWPAIAEIAPGDLRRFAPSGLGLAPPTIVQPWDTLDDVAPRASYYGTNARGGDHFHDAPVNEPAGGTLYFDGGSDRAQLAAALALLDVQTELMHYALYAAESANPPQDRYLAQIRIVDFGAMDLFGARPGPDDRPWRQTLTVGEVIDAFIDAQRAIWGTGWSAALRGTLGGDGDWAKEKLAFGLMVENASNAVYRLWSRPWLVTK